jgi:UDP:flavonoid glycosyltransferase YjiC (YdhE family)
VQPYVALGRGLQAAGHEVRIVADEAFADFVTGNALGAALSAKKQDCAKRQGDKIWAEDGVGEAVGAVGELLGRRFTGGPERQ